MSVKNDSYFEVVIGVETYRQGPQADEGHGRRPGKRSRGWPAIRCIGTGEEAKDEYTKMVRELQSSSGEDHVGGKWLVR